MISDGMARLRAGVVPVASLCVGAARWAASRVLALWRHHQEARRQARDRDREHARRLLDSPACTHCGGWHLRACPRVRRLRFGPDGSLREVEFRADWRWERRVVWHEELLRKAG